MGIVYVGFKRPTIADIFDDMFAYGGKDNNIENFEMFYSSLPDVITEDIVRVEKAHELHDTDGSAKYYSIHDDAMNMDYALSKQDIISSYIDAIFNQAQAVPIKPINEVDNPQEFQFSHALNQAKIDSGKVGEMMKDYVFSEEFLEKNNVELTPQELSVLEKLEEIFNYEEKRPQTFRNCMSPEYLSTHVIEWEDASGQKQQQKFSDALNEIMDKQSGGKAILELLVYGTSRLIPGSQTSDASPLRGYAALQVVERLDGKTNGQTINTELLTNNQTSAFGDPDESLGSSLSLESLLSSANAEAILDYVNKYSTKILDYDLTPNKYFCGNDAYVFLNGVRVGEVTYIDWTLTEKKQPIYGYASYTFDDIAVGARMVTGKISVNFTKTRYLDGIQIYNQENLKNTNLGIEPIVNSVQDIFQSMDEYDADEAVARKKAYIRNIFDNRDDKELSKVIQMLEDQMLNNNLSSTIVDRSQQPYFNNPRLDNSHEGFTIMIPWGDELFKIAGLESNGNETLTIINDVYITSESSEVHIGAENVQQVFTYIARDLNNTILTKEEKIDIYKLQSNA